MNVSLLIQLIALSIFTLFMGICFCDGFKLPIVKKLVWFICFLFLSIYILKRTNQLALELILPIPLLLAIGLGRWEVNRARDKDYLARKQELKNNKVKPPRNRRS
jgi:hypothetical protein